MRVLIVGPYVRDGQYSIPAFVSTLASGLKALNVEVATCAPNETRFGKAIRPVVGKRTSFIDKFLMFPAHLRKLARGFDCVHIAEHGYAPYARQLRNKPHTITCHDLIVAKAARGELEGWPLSGPAKQYQESIIRGLARADHVVAISEMTRQDVIRLAHRSPERTSMVYIGFCRQVSPMDLSQANEIVAKLNVPTERPWLLHIGGDQPNKNKVGTARIFGEMQRQDPSLNLDMVFAGSPPDKALLDAISELPQAARVHFVVRPSDEQVMALYTLAKALLFPSLYEGFGLPIIEAQACGTPAITSNRPPMTEVGGDAAIYIDPEDPASAASTILKSLPSIHERIPLGFENIRRFDSQVMCQHYRDIYCKLVGER